MNLLRRRTSQTIKFSRFAALILVVLVALATILGKGGGDTPPPPPPQGPAAPIVVTVTPADGSAFDTLPTEITVAFSEDMDASLVSATTVKLLGSGGDGSFADGNELPVNLASIGLSNPRLLSIDLTGVASNPDDYQLRLLGSGVTALASVAGLILDGDDDGSAGGDFTSVFTINPPPACDTDTMMPPTAALTQPVAGTFMGTITVAADASDDQAVTSVTFFADAQQIGFDNSAPYEIEWDTTSVTNGPHDITAQATDGCNTTISAPPVTVNVDNPTTWTANAAPVFQDKCSPCHTGQGMGGHNIATVYLDALKPAVVPVCATLNIGQCTIVRIQSGAMPFGRGCTGDPSLDAGNQDCLTQAEQDIIQDWIDDGLPE